MVQDFTQQTFICSVQNLIFWFSYHLFCADKIPPFRIDFLLLEEYPRYLHESLHPRKISKCKEKNIASDIF